MEPGKPDPSSSIPAALFDYQHLPGKYPRALRQPAILYSSVTEILQLASGRTAEGKEGAQLSNSVRLAARFFVGSALLYPGADHYALLGLERTADAALVKDRYRLMMRLLHPDMVSSAPEATTWPEDGAVRVNRAYGVLSSPEERSAYDRQLDAERKPPQAAPPTAPAAFAKATATRVAPTDPRLHLKRLASAFGAVGVLALLVVLFAGRQSEEGLVQRTVVAEASPAGKVIEPAPARTPSASPASPFSAPREVVQVAPPPAVAAPTLVKPAAQLPPPVPPATPARTTEIAQRIPTPAPVAPPVIAAPPAPQRLASVERIPAFVSPPIRVVPREPAPAAIAPPVARPLPIAEADLPQPAQTMVAASEPARQIQPPQRAQAPQALQAIAVSHLPPSQATMPARRPVLTLADVQPALSNLLQHMESGSGDRLLNMLAREARGSPSAQALLLHYNNLVGAGRPVKLSHVHFKAEPREDRLIVTGFVRLQIGEQPVGSLGEELGVQAEFVSRDGKVVLTRLARAQGS